METIHCATQALEGGGPGRDWNGDWYGWKAPPSSLD